MSEKAWTLMKEFDPDITKTVFKPKIKQFKNSRAQNLKLQKIKATKLGI